VCMCGVWSVCVCVEFSTCGVCVVCMVCVFVCVWSVCGVWCEVFVECGMCVCGVCVLVCVRVCFRLGPVLRYCLLCLSAEIEETRFGSPGYFPPRF